MIAYINHKLSLFYLAGGLKYKDNKKLPIKAVLLLTHLVRMKGLEPSRPKALVPKTSVSTNSTTSAYDTSELLNEVYCHFGHTLIC